MEGLSWLQTIVLMPIQKLAPMFLTSYLTLISLITQIILLSAILSAYVGALGGLNTMKLWKIMAFSSINHMSWMLVALVINDSLWISYISFYVVISSSVVFFPHSFQSFSISDLLTPSHSTLFSSLSILLSLLSLGGLPPFTGFVPKWMMIQAVLANYMLFPLLFLLSSALITLYFYLCILIPFIFIMTPSPSYNLKSFPIFSFSFFLPLLFSSTEAVYSYLFYLDFLGF